MALAVIFESGWQCMVDSPEVYAAKMASGFLADLPSSWDDTVFLSGIPGEYVAIARRKGWKWWVAAINGSASLSREFTIPTDFLISNLTYDAEIYYDVPATGDVTNIFMTVTYTNLLPVHIPPSGGWGMRLSVVPVDYDEWAETFGLTNVESSRQDIPAGAVDRNGISYMLGKSPYEYSQVISTRNIDIQNRGVTSLQWTRPAGYAGASPIPEFSHDLRNWFRADNIFNFIVNEDLQTGNEKLVLKSLNLEAQSMFLRLVSDDNPRKQPFLSQSDNMTRAGWLPIYAKNPHFENNSPLPDPGFLIGFPDTNSWTGGGLMDLSNPSGVKDRNLLNFFNEPTRKRHQTVAWLMSTVSPLKQSFPEYLQRNSRYLVKATIGHRGDDPDNTGFPNDFSVQFKAGDVHIPWTSQSFYRPAPNTFMDVLLYLDVPDDESATGIGSQISLEFHCASAGQVLIDDIEVYREISYEH